MLLCKIIYQIKPKSYSLHWQKKNYRWSCYQQQYEIYFKTAIISEVGSYTQTKSSGVYLRQKIGESPCTFTISKNNIESQSLTEDYTFWNSAKTSHYVWECIQKHGKLSPDPRTVPTPRCSSEKENKQKQNKVIYCKSVFYELMK